MLVDGANALRDRQRQRGIIAGLGDMATARLTSDELARALSAVRRSRDGPMPPSDIELIVRTMAGATILQVSVGNGHRDAMREHRVQSGRANREHCVLQFQRRRRSA